MREPVMWGIHAGQVGEADALFLKKNVVAMGWHEMGDLSKIAADREAFKREVAKTYPEAKPGAIPNYTGQLFRFVHEMQPGDLVLYPSKLDRQVHIGKVEGNYSYSADSSEHYPNRRSAKWLKAAPRTHFSQGALYEIGSAMSFFQVRNYADEFRAALENGQPPVAVERGETVAAVVEDNIAQLAHTRCRV